jgi:hypothetical protein|tara:strand:- start:410 stop:643 length:234 start_codon:yes stop_codon:yes gene_type:complete
MTLTRSDYEMIVECLTATSRPKGLVGFDENVKSFYHEIITNFIQHLSADNPRFNRTIFIEALDENGWELVSRGMLKD